MMTQSLRMNIKTHTETGLDPTTKTLGAQLKLLGKKTTIESPGQEAMKEEDILMDILDNNQINPMKNQHLTTPKETDHPVMEINTPDPLAMEINPPDQKDLRAEKTKEEGMDLEAEKVTRVEKMVARTEMEGLTTGIDLHIHHLLNKEDGEVKAAASPATDPMIKTETTEEETVHPHPEQTSEETAALHLPAQIAAGAEIAPPLHLLTP